MVNVQLTSDSKCQEPTKRSVQVSYWAWLQFMWLAASIPCARRLIAGEEPTRLQKQFYRSVVSPVHYCIGPNGNALLWTPKLPNICKWNSEFPPSDGFLISLSRLSLISRHNASSCICPGCLFCQHLLHWKLSIRCPLYFFTDRFGLQRCFRARLV